MRLADYNLGDLVVVDENGAMVYVILNYLMCSNVKGSVPHCALVDLVDPSTLLPVPHSWCSMDPQLEVIAVVETGVARRANLVADHAARMRRVGVTEATPDAGRDVDPMLGGKTEW